LSVKRWGSKHFEDHPRTNKWVQLPIEFSIDLEATHDNFVSHFKFCAFDYGEEAKTMAVL
jgi:hypothetical protein